MRIKILGVGIDKVSFKQAVSKIINLLDSDKNNLVVTANPEIIICAQNDSRVKKALENASLIFADGIGVVIASRLIGTPLPERVPGVEVVQSVLKRISKTDKTAYFFGAAPGVAEKAAQNMQKKYKGLKIVGTCDGYFDEKKERLIIDDIKRLKPDLLLVALGVPKQELWVADNIDLPVKVCICCGGTLNVLSGTVSRGPKILYENNLEWLYRITRHPLRIAKFKNHPVFVYKVLKDFMFGNKK